MDWCVTGENPAFCDCLGGQVFWSISTATSDLREVAKTSKGPKPCSATCERTTATTSAP